MADLSGVIADISGETVSPRGLARLRKIRPDSLPPVRGNPRSRFPSAAPKNTGSRTLAHEKKKSQDWRQTVSRTWLRNSREIPRRIRLQRTRKIAK